MLSFEKTILEFLEYIGRFLTTIFKNIFKPIKVLSITLGHRPSDLTSPLIYFLLSIILLFSFHINRYSNRYADPLGYIQSFQKQLIESSFVQKVYFLAPIILLIYLFLIIILKLIWPGTGNKKEYLNIAYYWYSTPLYLMYFYSFFIAFVAFIIKETIPVLYYDYGSQIEYLHDFLFFAIQGVAYLIPLYSISKIYFKADKSKWIKLSLLAIACAPSFYFTSSLFRIEQDFLINFKEKGIQMKGYYSNSEYLSVEYVRNLDSSFMLKLPLLISNRTDKPIYFVKNDYLEITIDSEYVDKRAFISPKIDYSGRGIDYRSSYQKFYLRQTDWEAGPQERILWINPGETKFIEFSKPYYPCFESLHFLDIIYSSEKSIKVRLSNRVSDNSDEHVIFCNIDFKGISAYNCQ